MSPDDLAPVIPLFSRGAPSAADDGSTSGGDADDAPRAGEREAAERLLLRRLRARQLSVAEARAVLTEQGLGTEAVLDLLDDFERRGYLDDDRLAEQIVHAGVDRKRQGRQVIAQTLAKRLIPRPVAEAALAALPDDDLERAVEFARGRARSMQALDRETALRRLTGQLSRRGYGGSLAVTAARVALDEHRGSGGVRFR